MIKKKHKYKIICFDFDGTLVEDCYPETGKVKKDFVKLTQTLKDKGYYIIINSGRDTIYYPEVKKVLDENGFAYDEISLKCKPTADLYIDDKSLYADTRLLENFISFHFSGSVDKYINNVCSEKLSDPLISNLQNDQNHPLRKDVRDNNFIVYLCMTGGVDSTTMWKMLEEAGTPYEMLYFKMGQEYWKGELEAIKNITGKLPKIIEMPISFNIYDYILFGRNLAVILKSAQLMKDLNLWGEIWFGNLQGESPTLGGDKSRRFFNDINHLLAVNGYDVRVVNPLIGIDKFDELEYWKNRDIEKIKLAKSCFSDTEFQCGKCQSCFRKWLAFKWIGVDISDTFTTLEFDKHITKYKNNMNKALIEKDFSHYSPERIRKTLKIIEDYES